MENTQEFLDQKTKEKLETIIDLIDKDLVKVDSLDTTSYADGDMDIMVSFSKKVPEDSDN